MISTVLPFTRRQAYSAAMIRPQRTGPQLLKLLRAHEAELRGRGVESLTLFGSAARGYAAAGSDVDLAMRPGAAFSKGGFDHFGNMDSLRDRLTVLLGCSVDLIEVPAARPRLRQLIEQEGLRAF